jgi:hypothetical protein
MKVLFENEFVKSWTTDEAPIIFSRVLKMPDSSLMLQNFCDLHLGFISELASRTQGPVFSICDTYIMQPFMFEVLVNYYAHVFPKQQRAGLVYKAFVKPRNFDQLTDASEFLKKIDQRPIGLFESFDQAFYFIKTEAKKALMQKPVVL